MKTRRRTLKCWGLLCLMAMAAPVLGFTKLTWNDSLCGSPTQCNFEWCRCQGNWNSPSSWTPGPNSPSTWPDEDYDQFIRIIASTGPADTPCISCDPVTCDVWSETCDDAFLMIDLTTTVVTLGRFEIITENQNSGDDYLFLAMQGSKTLIVDYVKFNAGHGLIVMEMTNGASLETQ